VRPVIQVRQLTKRYGATAAVDQLSFDVRPGVVTGFLGPNGSGKSTTMRLAARQPAVAATHLARATHENSEFAVLQTRTRLDLARALVRQQGSYSEGIAEMKRVEQRASELGMAGLAAQAAAERDQWLRPGP
jgi:ATPase subunit of ABC transporter with duplicated ATPase domains